MSVIGRRRPFGWPPSPRTVLCRPTAITCGMQVQNIGLRFFPSLGEGPLYDVATDLLTCVNSPFPGRPNPQGLVMRRKLGDPTRKTEEFSFGPRIVSFMIPTTSGKYLVGSENSILELNWPSEPDQTPPSHRVVASLDEGKQTSINDAKCDFHGRLLAGTEVRHKVFNVPYEGAVGSFYGIDKDFSVRKFDDGFLTPNGMAWSGDGRHLFLNDYLLRKTFVFDYDAENFTATNRRLLLDLSVLPKDMGRQDGMAIDSDDRVWIACFSGSQVICVDSTTGQILQKIKFPTRNITSCCFAGPHLNELVVTTACDYEVKSDEEGGSLYRVTNVNAKGFSVDKFDG